MSDSEWNDIYSFYIDNREKHHNHLISLLNELLHKTMQGAQVFDIITFANNLLHHTTYIFNREEHLMSKYGFPQFTIHKQEHNTLIVMFHDINEAISFGDINFLHDNIYSIVDYLNKHRHNTDAKFGHFIADKSDNKCLNQ